MKCDYHDYEMEWIDDPGHPEGGYWFCDLCRIAEEEVLEDEAGAFIDEPCCVYCGQTYLSGYCWQSPDGNHHGNK